MRFDARKNPAGAAAGRGAGKYTNVGFALVAHGDRRYLVSTDGHMLVMVEAESEDGDAVAGGSAYPASAAKAAIKAARRGQPASIALNGAAVVIDKEGARTEFPALDQRFPDVSGIVPCGQPEGVATFDAELLVALQRALGAKWITVEYHGAEVPAVVRPVFAAGTMADGSFGVVMPIARLE